jgi:transcriptional regulator with XRE-family HTH domain
MTKRHTRIEVDPQWVAAIEAWRKEKGLSQQALGEAAGISQSTISRVVAGDVTAEAAEKLARLTGIPAPHQVIGEERHRMWVEYGQRLDRISPRLFLLELSDLKHLVDLLEARQRRRDESMT